MACCDEFQKDENKVIKNGDLKGTTVQGTGALSGSGVVNATSSGTISIEHKTKFSGTGQTSPNTSQSPSFGGSFNVPVVKYDEYGHITGSTTTTVTLPTPEAQNRTELYVGTGSTTTGNTASTNGNTKIKLGYTNGSAWDSKIISGGSGVDVVSDTNGNIIIKNAQDSGRTPTIDVIENWLKTSEGKECRGSSAGNGFATVGNDTFFFSQVNFHNIMGNQHPSYIEGYNYDNGVRLHCPLWEKDESAPVEWVYDDEGNTIDHHVQGGFDQNNPLKGKYEEVGLFLCGADNPCGSGTSERTWSILNNGGHLSISRKYNHGRCNSGEGTECFDANFLACESPLSQSDEHPHPEDIGKTFSDGVYNCAQREWVISSTLHVRSDRRSKRDIRPLSDEEINKFWNNSDDLIKSFKLKNNERTQYGVIAQEVEEIMPNAVSHFEALSVDYDSVYGALIGTLIKKVKELEKKVEELEKK